MSDACAINVSRSVITNSRSINYKNITIVRHYTDIKMTPHLGASLTDNSRSIIYDCNICIIQATDCVNFSVLVGLSH
jgi:hypothetical protein